MANVALAHGDRRVRRCGGRDVVSVSEAGLPQTSGRLALLDAGPRLRWRDSRCGAVVSFRATHGRFAHKHALCRVRSDVTVRHCRYRFLLVDTADHDAYRRRAVAG